MSKDPALLFYPKDVLADCSLLDDKQCGFYMKFICLQHQFGHLSESQVIKICGTLDKDLLFVLKKDESGSYYVDWVDREMKRRQEFSESRRKNRLGKGKIKPNKKTSDSHLETATVTIIDINKGGIQGGEVYGFENFWNDYGKKEDTKKCKDKWGKLTDEEKGLIKVHVPKYVSATPDRQFRKNPLTYLNGKCWNDEVYPKSDVTPSFKMPTEEEIRESERKALESFRAK